MSRHGVILDTSQPRELALAIERYKAAWPVGYEAMGWPRARWLSDVESLLAVYFPRASSRDRNDTARSLAPFPLAESPTAP